MEVAARKTQDFEALDCIRGTVRPADRRPPTASHLYKHEHDHRAETHKKLELDLRLDRKQESPFASPSLAAASSRRPARMARAALLVLFLVQNLSVLAAAARPLAGDGWLDDGLGAVVEIFRAAKSGPGPPSHCCK